MQVEKSVCYPPTPITIGHETLENTRSVLIPETLSSLTVRWFLSTVQPADVTVSLLPEVMTPKIGENLKTLVFHWYNFPK